MSFFTSLNGLRNAETDLAVISNNIANSETVGFKRSSAQFADLVATGGSTDQLRTPGIGATVTQIAQDFSLGAFEQSGRGLDVAISGDGFIATANAVSGDITFTRNGSLQIVSSGQLQDAFGDVVQSFPTDAAGNATSTTPGNTTIPLTNAAGASLTSVTIDSRGIIGAAYTDGTNESVGQIALAAFSANDGLRAIGGTKYEATAESGAPTFGEPGVGNFGGLLSGALERSNVDLAEELVGLLIAQRNFQANARAIDTNTTITTTALNLQS